MRPSLFLLCLIGLALGCASSKVGSVSGKVTLDGKPLANARVNFQPMGETLNPGIGSFGKANANGEYTLALIDGSSSGAIVGQHKVAISAYDSDPKEEATDERRNAPVDRVPFKYNLKTDLTFEVRPGENVANFDLKSR